MPTQSHTHKHSIIACQFQLVHTRKKALCLTSKWECKIIGYKVMVILIKYTAYIKIIIHNKHQKLVVAK